jgi:hypothetical protein
VYRWIWRALPGGTATRSALALLLALAACALLLFVVFPVVEPYMPFTSVTVDPTR